MIKFAIVGTGALGGYYGGLLARAGNEVHFLANTDVQHIREHGLHVETKQGNFHLPQVSVYGNAHSMPPCDCVIVALKGTSNHRLPELLPPLMHENSIVLVLQNGLHVEQDTRNVVGPGRVAGGCCFLCSNKVGPGHIRHLDYGRILMGPYKGLEDDEPGPSMDRLTEIQNTMVQAGIECQTTDSLTWARWRKLMWNIPFNGLSVVLDASTDKIMKHPASRALAESIIREVRQTACNCGAYIEPEFVKVMMDQTDQMVPYDSSMRLDYLAGRSIEVESIFGNALRAAARKQVESPKVQMLYEQLRFLADRRIAMS